MNTHCLYIYTFICINAILFGLSNIFTKPAFINVTVKKERKMLKNFLGVEKLQFSLVAKETKIFVLLSAFALSIKSETVRKARTFLTEM